MKKKKAQFLNDYLGLDEGIVVNDYADLDEGIVVNDFADLDEGIVVNDYLGLDEGIVVNDYADLDEDIDLNDYLGLKGYRDLLAKLTKDYSKSTIGLHFMVKKGVGLSVWGNDIFEMSLLTKKVCREIVEFCHMDKQKVNLISIDKNWRNEDSKFCISYESSNGDRGNTNLKESVNKKFLKSLRKKQPIIDDFVNKSFDSIKDKPCKITISGVFEGVSLNCEDKTDFDEVTIHRIVENLKEAYKTMEAGKGYLGISDEGFFYINGDYSLEILFE